MVFPLYFIFLLMCQYLEANVNGTESIPTWRGEGWLLVPGLGMAGLPMLWAASVIPEEPEPTDASGRRKPQELEGDGSEFYKRHHQEPPPTPAFD